MANNTEQSKFANNRQTFFSTEDDFYYLRKHIYEMVTENIQPYLKRKQNLNVLEIGPEGNYDQNSVYPEFSTTNLIKNYCNTFSSNYYSLDIIDGCDFKGSIEKLSEVVPKEMKFDVIIVLSVLEHVGDIFSVPSEMYKVTNDKARIFINTPLMFKVHGPVPDFWRITKYGYEHLFKDLFSLTIFSYPEFQTIKNSSALSLNVIGDKI